MRATDPEITTHRTRVRAAALLLALAWLGLADAALAAAGRVLFVAGPVSVERGGTRPLAKGDPVETGDVIVTGDKARAQLLMNDGARLALRAGTRYRIDAFALPAAVNSPAQATGTMASGSSVASLLKGGFRTATGAIGKGPGGTIDEQAYQLKTPIGTLGIRGTEYVAVWCAGDCADAPGVGPGQVIRDGLYLWVTEGAVVFRYAGREIVVHAGEIIFIPADTQSPEDFTTPPAWLKGDGAGPITLAGQGRKPPAGAGILRGFNERRGPAATFRQLPDGVPPTDQPGYGVTQTVAIQTRNGGSVDISNGQFPGNPRRDVAYGVPSTQISTAGIAVASNQFPPNSQGDLTRFFGPLPSVSGAPVSGTYDIGSASNVDTGRDPVTGIRWGRWTGGVATFTAGQTAPLDLLTTKSLPWVMAPDTFLPLALPTTGSANYRLVGGTNPTDAQGNVGTLGNLSLRADFTNQAVTSDLALNINNASWTATGAGSIGAQAGVGPTQFGGNYNVLIGGQQLQGTGSFTGFFSQPTAVSGGVPNGAGISYELHDNQGQTSVTGAAGLRVGP